MLPTVDTPEQTAKQQAMYMSTRLRHLKVFKDLPVQGISLLRRVHCCQLPRNHQILPGRALKT